MQWHYLLQQHKPKVKHKQQLSVESQRLSLNFGFHLCSKSQSALCLIFDSSPRHKLCCYILGHIEPTRPICDVAKLKAHTKKNRTPIFTQCLYCEGHISRSIGLHCKCTKTITIECSPVACTFSCIARVQWPHWCTPKPRLKCPSQHSRTLKMSAFCSSHHMLILWCLPTDNVHDNSSHMLPCYY